MASEALAAEQEEVADPAAGGRKVYILITDCYFLINMVQYIVRVEHSPTLATVVMVEETIKKAKEIVSLAEIKRRLPKKVNHNTLKVILSYLHASGKIEFTPDGVIWTFVPKEDIAKVLNAGRTWT